MNVKKEKREKKSKLVEKKKKTKAPEEFEESDSLYNKAQHSTEPEAEEEEKATEGEKEVESTESAEAKLYMVDFNQCDPKKCSGRKLETLGLLKSINHKNRFKGITLSASGKKYISAEDRDIILKYGLCVIDCSWNKIKELEVKTKFDHERILPFMVAVNPINFGAPYKLSCAEALAAGLYICDFWDQGNRLMEKFKWGPGFLNLNEEIFGMYETCKNPEDLKKAEQLYLENAKKAENRSKQRELPPSSSESEEEQDEDNENEDNNDEGDEKPKGETKTKENDEEND